jgi:uncharacterized protein (TIGR03067 family)
MLRHLLICVLAGLVGAAEVDPEPKKPAQAVLKSLQGDWDIVKMVMEGRDETKEMPKGAFVRFAKNQMIFKDGTNDDPATITLDPKQKPPHFDHSADGDLMKGIYKLEKDTLTIAFNDDGQDRPRSFDKSYGLIVLKKRAKKK